MQHLLSEQAQIDNRRCVQITKKGAKACTGDGRNWSLRPPLLSSTPRATGPTKRNDSCSCGKCCRCCICSLAKCRATTHKTLNSKRAGVAQAAAATGRCVRQGFQ